MKQCGKTRELLLMHYKTYPNLQIQDVFKFLYQSTFGCGHYVSSSETATDLISREYNSMCRKEESVIDRLDGSYSRVPLSYMNGGLSPETFGKLFVASSEKEKSSLSELKVKLEIAKSLACEHLLPFSEKDFEEAIAEWKNKGFLPIHHSDIFRESYQPSYRVISNEYIPFLPLFAELDKLLEKKRAIIAVEGGSASGKTTLSKILEDIYPCSVFHMDDFFLRPEQRTPERYAEVGGNVDRERFLSEVSEPLSKGNDVVYRSFDCSAMSLSEGKLVCPEKLVIVEGAYSMHPELERYYDFSVFLDVSPELQRERILRRNSPQTAQLFFDQWIPLENTYFTKTDIKKRCSMTICIFQD